MAKTKLNQIIAIEKGVKSRAYSVLTDLNKIAQKPDLFNGFSKNYEKTDDAGESMPSESKRVQHTTKGIISQAAAAMTQLISITARKDWTNCIAKADVKIDDKVIIAGAPVSFLLFMEKQLNDLGTLVSNLPILDDNEVWNLDVNADMYKSDVVQTHRTKKVQEPIVLYNATPEHPAQTQLITNDKIVGYWKQTKFSSAIPKKEKAEMLERIIELSKAVKTAREEANLADEVSVPNVADNIFDYIVG